MAVDPKISTNGKFKTYAGTYQEVIDALDAMKTPGNKVIGFAWVSAGNCVVLVHNH